MTGALQYSLLAGVILALSLAFSAFVPMSDRNRKAYLILSLGLLAFFSMFHSSDIGNDTAMYINRFNAISESGNPFSYIKSTVMEPGYVVYNFLLSRLVDDPQILFVVSGAIIYFSIGRFLQRYCEAPGLVVYALVAMLYFDTYLTMLRQSLAFAIALVAYPYIERGRPARFLAIMLLAATFHYSALVFLLAYPISRMRERRASSCKVLRVMGVAAIMVIAFVGFDRLLSALLTLFPKYNYYNGTERFGKAEPAVVLKVLIFSLMYAVPRFLSPGGAKPEGDDAQGNGREMAHGRFAIFNIVLLILSLNASVMTRLAGYFGLFSLVDFSGKTVASGRRTSVVITMLSIGLLYLYGFVIVVYRTPEWFTTYPFAFCFM